MRYFFFYLLNLVFCRGFHLCDVTSWKSNSVFTYTMYTSIVYFNAVNIFHIGIDFLCFGVWGFWVSIWLLKTVLYPTWSVMLSLFIMYNVCEWLYLFEVGAVFHQCNLECCQLDLFWKLLSTIEFIHYVLIPKYPEGIKLDSL